MRAGSYRHCQSWACSPCHNNIFLYGPPEQGPFKFWTWGTYFSLGPLAAVSGWEMCLSSSEGKRQQTPSERPQGSSLHNGCTKSSSRTCLFWTTLSGNIINNKIALSQHRGISTLQPNAFSLSKWHSDVFWDNSIGTCQDTCWLLQTETHSSLNSV